MSHRFVSHCTSLLQTKLTSKSSPPTRLALDKAFSDGSDEEQAVFGVRGTSVYDDYTRNCCYPA